MKTDLTGILNNLASRGVLNSSVASDAISKGMGNVVNQTAQKGYEAAALGSSMKAELPKLLAAVAELGKYSETSNPLQPYALLAQYDLNTM